MDKLQRQKNKLALCNYVKVVFFASDDKLSSLAAEYLPKRSIHTRNEKQAALLLHFIELLFP